MARALVWFKRDLRTDDHAPLIAAAACDEALGLFVVEPAWLVSPEFEPQHLAFLTGCIDALRPSLHALGLPLLLRCAPLTQVLEDLHRRLGFTHLFSHEETGPRWTWDRDRAVARWCRERGVVWQEFPQNGVVRRLASRRGWAGRWQGRMDAPVLAPPTSLRGLRLPVDLPLGDLPTRADLQLPSSRPVPAAGQAAARALLDDFLQHRGRRYRHELSSPLTADSGCSRLSPHLAFGTLSMRQVHQAAEARIAALRALETEAGRDFARHLRGFTARLRWHCHFMQKLEDEPDIEFRNFARSADALRDDAPDRERLDAWRAGRTGYPMVDACMRQLLATGWLNFRMRAMLVSFAAYHLWLHWREPGLHLARQFLDFEPGIHWSQMQMQSGTTGINTFRIYSPARQAAEHDPTGAYVRRWVPEWGTPAYPRPLVDERAALAQAKERLYALRRSDAARLEADAIQQRHGSRRSGLAPSQGPRGTRRTAPGQAGLFDE